MILRLYTYLKNSFFKDVLITTFGQVVIMLFVFVLNKVISNHLSVENFGVYNLAKRATGVITYVMLMAMGIALPKYISEYKEKKDELQMSYYMIASFFIVIVCCIICSVGIFIGKDLFAKLIFDDINYTNLVLPILLFASVSSIATYCYSYFRGIGDYKKYNSVQLFVQIITIVVVLVIGNDIRLVFIWWGISIAVFLSGYFFVILKQHFKQIGKFHKIPFYKAVSQLISYGLPRVLGEFVLFSYHLVPISIVTHKFGLEQAACFSVAISINSMITPLFGFVGVVLLPLASKSLVNRETSELKKNMKLLLILYLLISVVAIGIIGIFTEFFICLLFDTKYLEAVSIVKIVVLSLLPNALYLLYRNPLDGISKFPYNTVCLSIAFSITVVVMLLADTIVASAWAFVLGYVILGILSFLAWKHVIKIKQL